MKVQKKMALPLFALLVLAGASIAFVQPASAVVKTLNGTSTKDPFTGVDRCDCTQGSGCTCQIVMPNPTE